MPLSKLPAPGNHRRQCPLRRASSGTELSRVHTVQAGMIGPQVSIMLNETLGRGSPAAAVINGFAQRPPRPRARSRKSERA